MRLGQLQVWLDSGARERRQIPVPFHLLLSASLCVGGILGQALSPRSSAAASDLQPSSRAERLC